ncbi:unnamed protein product [Closterium sp. NIES-54]
MSVGLLAMIFTIVWTQASSEQQAEREGQCGEWAAFIESHFNSTQANTRALAEFVHAYYIDGYVYHMSGWVCPLRHKVSHVYHVRRYAHNLPITPLFPPLPQYPPPLSTPPHSPYTPSPHQARELLPLIQVPQVQLLLLCIPLSLHPASPLPDSPLSAYIPHSPPLTFPPSGARASSVRPSSSSSAPPHCTPAPWQHVSCLPRPPMHSSTHPPIRPPDPPNHPSHPSTHHSLFLPLPRAFTHFLSCPSFPILLPSAFLSIPSLPLQPPSSKPNFPNPQQRLQGCLIAVSGDFSCRSPSLPHHTHCTHPSPALPFPVVAYALRVNSSALRRHVEQQLQGCLIAVIGNFPSTRSPSHPAVVGYALRVNSTALRRHVEQRLQGCLIAVSAEFSCRPPGLPLYVPLLLGTSRNEGQSVRRLPRNRTAAGADLLSGEP